MRQGVRLGVDVGRARVGLARSDMHGLLATPVDTVVRSEASARIAGIAQEVQAIECVVGLPLSLSGAQTQSTADAKEFAAELAQVLSIPVRLVDERLSTVTAQNQLRSQGIKAKSQRPLVDQVAAVIILQHCLDSERAQGVAPGIIFGEAE